MCLTYLKTWNCKFLHLIYNVCCAQHRLESPNYSDENPQVARTEKWGGVRSSEVWTLSTGASSHSGWQALPVASDITLHPTAYPHSGSDNTGNSCMSGGTVWRSLKAQFTWHPGRAEIPKMAVDWPAHKAATPGILVNVSWSDQHTAELCGGNPVQTQYRDPASPASMESLINQTLDNLLMSTMLAPSPRPGDSL